MKNKIAFVFPAFITDFTLKELDFLDENRINLNDYLQRIAAVLHIDLPSFSYDSELYLKNELYSQLLAYSFSCAICDVLISKRIFPQWLAGYSMGIYAALYASKSLSFEDGARIIFQAYDSVSEIAQTKLYGMAAIIGLTVNDVEQLIAGNKLDLEIINLNNEHSLVIAGKKNEISVLLQKAKEEGALTTAELAVNTPYHSKYLLTFTKAFEAFINTLTFEKPIFKIISTYDQRIIEEVPEIKNELLLNLTQKINWNKTMQKLIENKVDVIYECGAGKDLKKISRFICGDYQMKSIYKL